MDNDSLTPVFIPPLVVLLAHAEQAKGSALTPGEVVSIRDRGVCIMLRRSAAAEMAQNRGYDDLEPEDVWEQWQARRETFLSNVEAAESELDGTVSRHAAPTLESLIALVGLPVTSADVQWLVAADHLESSTDTDLEEGQSPRGYLSCLAGGYLLSHRQGRVNTLFVFVLPADAHQAFRGPLFEGLSPASTRANVRSALGQPALSGEAQSLPVLGRKGAWDRYNRGSLCLHFECTELEEQLRQITVMTADTAP